MKALLKDSEKTQFAVVTIPTALAVAESKRLISSLRKQGVYISCLLCNQILSTESGPKYIDTRNLAQQQCIDTIKKTVSKIETPIEVTEVGYLDTEVAGIYGLRYFSTIAHPLIPHAASHPKSSKKIDHIWRERRRW